MEESDGSLYWGNYLRAMVLRFLDGLRGQDRLQRFWELGGV